MDILLVKLFIAHLLGDFFFQFDSWVKDKELNKLRSVKLYIHILIHGLLAIILVWQSNFIGYAILLMLIHGIIDAAKLCFQKNDTRRFWFFTDQLLHVLSLILVWYAATSPNIDFNVFNQRPFWFLSAAVLLLTFPASVLIRILIAKWTPKTIHSSAEASAASLESAGKYIGIMERLLIFVFIYTGHFEAVGFLLAAKSIFRFGDLKEGNDLKLTEYILIGTLLSFGFAVLISLLATHLSS